jgi:predicted negative regulator of RcsB-dependent stress response
MTVQWGSAQPVHGHKNQLQKTLEWSKAHQEALAVIGIICILLLIGIPYYLHSQEQSEKDAQAALSIGQYYLQAPVDPQRGPFKTEMDRLQEALKTFQRITTDYAGTPTARVARYYAAKCQFSSGQYAQAYVNFEEAYRQLKGTPLADEAALGKVLCLAAQAQWVQAISGYEAFLSENPDSFLAPEARLNLAAAYLKSQNNPKALEQLKLTAEKYPDTAWGKEAASRLARLQPKS